MFVGRQHELGELERLYAKGSFQMVVLYGRRRVGKTALTAESAKDKPALVFTAKIHWGAALAFIAQQAKDTHLASCICLR